MQKGRSSINLVFSISKSYFQTFAEEGSEEATPRGDNQTIWKELRTVTLPTSPRGNEGERKAAPHSYFPHGPSASPPSFSCLGQQIFPVNFLCTVSFLSTPGPSQPHPRIGALHPSSSPLLTSSHVQTARVSLAMELPFSFLRQRASSHVLNSLLTYIIELRPCSKRFLLFDASPLCTVSSQTLCSVPT